MRVALLLLSLLLCAGSPRVDGAASSASADAAGDAAARWSPLESAFPPLTSSTSESTTNPSSSSSSSSSSSTNGTNTSPAAAAAATPTTNPVPALLPHIALSLQLVWNGTTLQLRQPLVADLALAMGVSARRILLTQLLVYRSGRVAARFAVTPALHSAAASAQNVASKFLVDATNGTFAALPVLQHIGNETALATPSSAAALLQEVRFGLQLDLAALPGGSVDAFSELLVADLAPICGVPEWRLHPLSVGAPSVQVAFAIAPPLVVTHLAPSVAVQHFVDAVANSTSALYSGTITGYAVAGTVRVGTPGAMDGVDNSGSDEGYWTRTRILCAAAGAGAGVFILLGGGIWICVSEKNNRAAKLAAAATLAKNKELASVRASTPLHTAHCLRVRAQREGLQ